MSNNLRIGIASDHAGTELKKFVHDFLSSNNYQVKDYGPNSSDSVDYPDFAKLCAMGIKQKEIDVGILICGTGIGMSITANKTPGIRAALVYDEFTTRMTKKHNNSNIICLGSRTINKFRALDLVKIWLEEEYEGGRHQRRLDKITELEQSLK